MSSVVPEGWTKERLGNYVKLESGNAFQSLEFSDKGTPIVRISNIRNGKIDLSNAVYYEGNNRLEKFLIANGDILLAMSGATTGKIGKYTYSFKSYLNQRVGRFKIIDKTKSENEYIYQLVRSREFAENTLIDAIGGAQPNISSSQVENVVYKFPPLPEQKKIASILTSVDEVIENTQKQINKLQDLKKATMNELLTKGIGHTEFKDSELGRIPKSWLQTTIGKLAKVKRGASPRPIQDPKWWGGSVGWTRISDVTSSTKYLNNTKDYLSSEGVKKSVQIDIGEVILSICATIGRPIIVNSDVCIHDGFVWFEGLSDNVDREFYYYTLCLKEQQLASSKQTGTQGNLNTDIVSRLKINLPPLLEQKKIASIITSMDKIIEENQRKLAQTESLKKSLMQDLLTGKVRVSVN